MIQNGLIKRLVLALPIAVALVFFAWLPFKFNATIYVNNIVGEGACDTYISSSDEPFAHLYKGDAYFGSELKTLKIRDLLYNVETINISLFNVEEADILSFDISVFGITVCHLNKQGLTHPYIGEVQSAVNSEDDCLFHVEVEKPEEGITINFPGAEIIPKWIWVVYFLIIMLISAVLGMILQVIFRYYPKVELVICEASLLIATMICGCFFCGSLPYVAYTKFILNGLILFALAMFINAFIPQRIGAIAVSILACIWYVANYYVISFRGKPIMPSDLRAFKTAMEVVKGYSLIPNWKMVLGFAIAAVYNAFTVLCGKKLNKEYPVKAYRETILKRFITAVSAVILIVFSFNNPVFESVNSFAWDANLLESFHREGIVLSFAKNAINSTVKKPDAYSRELIASYLEEYGREETNAKGIQPTNIIMIMNEAFSDLREVGLSEEIDVMPYIDSLNDNILEGTLYSSVFAGGTCNTEFEALTGNTLAFLGVGAYPYTENVNEPLFSLASYFSEKTYMTDAFHPNEANNWNRNKVYPLLGFSDFLSLEDYYKNVEVSFPHSNADDMSNYEYIEKVSEENKDKKRFLFNVTMQNHSGYEHFEEVQEDETVQKYGESLGKEARVYLSLIKMSDDAVKQLIDTYKNSNEPTMIVFFGDHQPGLDKESQNSVYTNASSNLDYFKTKFFIWTNYETETVHDYELSANYLPLLVLERGNFELPPYVRMLREIYEKYPVISSQGVKDSAGNIYNSVDDVSDDPWIIKYRNIQYANLFDEIAPEWFDSAD